VFVFSSVVFFFSFLFFFFVLFYVRMFSKLGHHKKVYIVFISDSLYYITRVNRLCLLEFQEDNNVMEILFSTHVHFSNWPKQIIEF